ncbi:kelch repeat-containing protein [Pelagicoccus sp. SDUM812005]|uniref:Kelch repeat-containing protein n=1 Tax=Pelagicoccus sp. SDUM812005 TaxID=3041257 RepID=UPI00280E4860|nr:kelch repeat-containing protein [Pelagicoccus sp. SDUM812005]MDQ8180224.1 kelch repeat-containing protein [Pelagicoccus sp. SDUM812005]
MKSKTRLTQPIHDRKSSPYGWLKLVVGLLALTSSAILQGQDDLPFSSGSTGADGPLIVPPHPITRQGHVLGYDPVNEQYVMFGGYWGNSYYPETWVTSDPTLGWTEVETDTFVSGRANAAIAWDYLGERLVMFGGYRADGTKLDDMWAWDGTDWTQIAVDTPTPRDWHSLVSDPVTKKMWIVGGYSATNQQLNDVWEWDGTDWSDLGNTGITPSRSHQYAKAIYNEADSSILLYSENYRKTYKYESGAWSEIATGSSPDVGWGYTFVYDPTRESGIIFGGTSDRDQTWEFKNGDWSIINTSNIPTRRYNHAATYDSVNQQIVIINGYMDAFSNSVANEYGYDAWSFSTGEWTYLTGRLYYFDMTEKADGIWNFTTIDIPSNIEMRFTKNAANTPVVWLATGAVNIGGILRLDGQNAKSNDGSDNYALGGPGGAPGGLGAIRRDVSGNYAGTPGQGAGGGAPGVTSGQYGSDGNFKDTYGNTLLLPLVGGSGGGGGASTDTGNGGHGAGGGGAILIASDLDITINGHINTDGGDQTWGGGSYGGHGSGGAIKLMADRVQGSGVLWARGGRAYSDARAGRIRIEAFFRPLAAKATPPATATAPIAAPDFGDIPTLTVTSVDGENVALPPSGNLQTPDVVFTAAGTVSILVDSENIPEGTPVTLRITTSGEIITLPAVDDPDVTVDANGQATFEATVPAGLGTIQAFSEFTP